MWAKMQRIILCKQNNLNGNICNLHILYNANHYSQEKYKGCLSSLPQQHKSMHLDVGVDKKRKKPIVRGSTYHIKCISLFLTLHTTYSVGSSTLAKAQLFPQNKTKKWTETTNNEVPTSPPCRWIAST